MFRTSWKTRNVCWEKTRQTHERLNRYDKKKYKFKRKKLSENLNTGEKKLVLAERIKKKSVPRKFYKQSVQNITYFKRYKIFSIIKKQKIDKINYYRLKNLEDNKISMKIFQRKELFAIENNFIG